MNLEVVMEPRKIDTYNRKVKKMTKNTGTRTIMMMK